MPVLGPNPKHGAKLRKKYGDQFFQEIGVYGGLVSGIKKGGFGGDPEKRGKDGMTPSERARYWGKINGAKNKGKKRGKNVGQSTGR